MQDSDVMRKSIFPISAILAAALIPMSANADLRNQYEGRGCNKLFFGYIPGLYSYSDPVRMNKCVNQLNVVVDANDDGTNPGSRLGSIGNQEYTQRCRFPYGCTNVLRQFEFEGNNLVQYECSTTDAIKCAGEVKKTIWKPVQKKVVIHLTKIELLQ